MPLHISQSNVGRCPAIYVQQKQNSAREDTIIQYTMPTEEPSQNSTNLEDESAVAKPFPKAVSAYPLPFPWTQ